MNVSVEVDTKFHSLLTFVLDGVQWFCSHSWGGWMDALGKINVFSVGLPARSCSLYWRGYFGSFVKWILKTLVASGILHYISIFLLYQALDFTTVCIILFLLPCARLKVLRGVVVFSHLFWVLKLDGGEWSVTRSSRFFSGKRVPETRLIGSW